MAVLEAAGSGATPVGVSSMETSTTGAAIEPTIVGASTRVVVGAEIDAGVTVGGWGAGASGVVSVSVLAGSAVAGSMTIVETDGRGDGVVSGDWLSKDWFSSFPAALSTNFESRSERESIVEFEGAEGSASIG